MSAEVTDAPVEEPAAEPPAKPIVIDRADIYDDIPDAVYHGDPVPGGSLSSSGARKLLPPSCPALFAWERDHGRPPKRHFDQGHAAHARVLGVGADVEVVQKVTKDKKRVDADDYRTTSAQEHAKEIRAAGKVPLLRKELDLVDGMAAAIKEHPIARVLFDPDLGGEAEQSLFWHDPAFDVWRRARLDWLPGQLINDRLIIPDYKTTASAEPAAFAKSVFNLGYHMQDDFYTDGALALGLADEVGFVFVAQEKDPPFLITVHECDPLAKAMGQLNNRRALGVFAECQATGVWPGYSDDVEKVSPPQWLARQYEGLVL